MKDTKNPRQNKGFLALLIGMAAGFVFLISIWVGYSTDVDHSSTLFVAAFCSLLSAVLIFLDKSKKKSCNVTVPTDDRHE